MGETKSLLRGLQLLQDCELPSIRASMEMRKDLSPEQRNLVAEHWHAARLELFACAVHGSRCTHERKLLGVSFWRELARCYHQVLGHAGMWRDDGDGLYYSHKKDEEKSRWYDAQFAPCSCGLHKVEEVMLLE